MFSDEHIHDQSDEDKPKNYDHHIGGNSDEEMEEEEEDDEGNIVKRKKVKGPLDFSGIDEKLRTVGKGKHKKFKYIIFSIKYSKSMYYIQLLVKISMKFLCQRVLRRSPNLKN